MYFSKGSYPENIRHVINVWFYALICCLQPDSLWLLWVILLLKTTSNYDLNGEVLQWWGELWLKTYFIAKHKLCFPWKGVISSLGRKTSLLALKKLDYALLHQTFTLKAVFNDKAFFSCVKTQSDSTQNPINQMFFFPPSNSPRIILWTWEKMNFFLLHQTESCCENKNMSLLRELQKPPLRLNCYVPNFPEALPLWGEVQYDIIICNVFFFFFITFGRKSLLLHSQSSH